MATTGVEARAAARGLFVDTNILIYANVASAPLHEAALTALTVAYESGRTLWISRQVLREFAAARLRAQSFAKAASAEIVIQRLHYFESRFAVADETAAVTRMLCELLADTSTGGKHVHDANIVATMLVYGVPALLTHNVRDFNRFEDRIALETLA